LENDKLTISIQTGETKSLENPCDRLFDWSKTEIPDLISCTSPSPWEKVLGWAGVDQGLRLAFSQGLDRQTTWDLTHVSSSVSKVLKEAASIYKRGVQTRPGEAFFSTADLSYEVLFHNELDALTSNLPADGFTVIDGGCLKHHLVKHDLSLEVSETLKTMETVGHLITCWREHGSPSLWVAIGGGITGDLVGFAASLVGCQYIQVPTTLLSMIDSSIGGKTGVNYFPWGKNQLGRFHHPKAVHIWPGFIDTCEASDIRSGSAEGAKHALISGDKDLLAYWFTEGRSLTPAMLNKTLAVKADIVQRDPFERNLRALLNVGHTFGHALEAVQIDHQNHVLIHGECVAAGLVFETYLSCQLGFATYHFYHWLKTSLQSLGFAVTAKELEQTLNLDFAVIQEDLIRHMQADKKGKLSFALLKEAGFPVGDPASGYTQNISEQILSEILTSWRSVNE
jgi:3-dehydroquinate synthase